MAEDQVRFGRKKGFVVLFRSAAQDDRLSLEARGLFALMVSLPENWSFTVVGLARKAGCGKNKIRRILEELETVGYLLREQEHREGGQFGANIFVLQDEAPPLSQNLDNGEADTPTVVPKHRQRQNPSTVFGTVKNKDINKPPIVPHGDAPEDAPKPAQKSARSREKAPWRPEAFDALWQAYPREGRKAKQRARASWDRLRPEDELIAAMMRALDAAKRSELWRRGIGIPYVATWINQQRWTDEPDPPAGDVSEPDTGGYWADDPEGM